VQQAVFVLFGTEAYDAFQAAIDAPD